MSIKSGWATRPNAFRSVIEFGGQAKLNATRSSCVDSNLKWSQNHYSKPNPSIDSNLKHSIFYSTPKSETAKS